MRSAHRAIITAAAMGLATVLAGPASAAPTPSEALTSARTSAYPGEAYSYYRHRHRHHGGAGAAALGIGLAAGLIGAAIAAQQPAPQPVVVGGGPRWNRYCARKFGPSFDPGSGTYLASNGYRYPCE